MSSSAHARNPPDDLKSDPPDRDTFEFTTMHKAPSPLLENAHSGRAEDNLAELKSAMTPGAVSFRDILDRNRPHIDLVSDDEGEDTLDDVIVDRQGPLPDIRFKPSFYETLLLSWRNVVVVKVMGAAFSHSLLYNKLCVMWPFMSGCDMVDLENGYFQISLC
ncbi:low-density lipoprotein receptor-related protein 12 [Striga asiatica]|uniref:Low-density lipoprotein receptor-related protein 12 n=1 Tax=Striga asiatica TaxID=4170 RepID=A0A5A7PW13_STRAF|nr:low-density lipoprotein receptor-related protein 12 [Striga asiatica]